MISQDLASLAAYLEGRANRDEPLDRAELRQIAGILYGMLTSVRAMENRPVPANWRVITNPQPPGNAA